MKLIGILIMAIVAANAADAPWIPVPARARHKGALLEQQASFSIAHTKPPRPTADRTKFTNRYVIELKRFNISNDGTNPETTARGINEALQHAKKAKKDLIVFPKGTYLISEKIPIILDHTDTIIDLNGAVLQIRPNDSPDYSIIRIAYGARNLRLTNGTLKGDRSKHDFKTIKSAHLGGFALNLESGAGLEIDHLQITELSGFGVRAGKGFEQLNQTGYRAILATNVEGGGFSEAGLKVADPTRCRTSKPYDLTSNKGGAFGDQFEFGYIFGYGGYQGIFDRQYQACFYDENRKFISKKTYTQYRKNKIPKSAVYIHLEFNQPSAEAVSSGMVGSLTNLHPATDVDFHHNRIHHNRSGGLALDGGQRWILEENVIERNGGTGPSYGIAMMNGWELAQDIVIRKNRFIGNTRTDFYARAGSGILLKNNTFEQSVFLGGRVDEYACRSNRFDGGTVTFATRTGAARIQHNSFNNCDLFVEYDGRTPRPIERHPTPPITLQSNTLQNVRGVKGTYFSLSNCTLTNCRFIADKQTALVRLKHCALISASIEYKDGPPLPVQIQGCVGPLRESGPGLGRKNQAQ